MHSVSVDYDDEESLVKALTGQQFFIICLGVRTPPDTHSKLVRGAVKAGVPYIMPNVYGGDIDSQKLREDPLYGANIAKNADEITKLGAGRVVMVCGFWYEWSLVVGEQWFGFDVVKRKAVLCDDGLTKITVSTWDQCGRALAAFLNLPESGARLCVSEFKEKPFYFCSFRICQREMLDSLNRVMGTSDKDWEITYEPAKQRYDDGMAEMKSGNMLGFAKAMYAGAIQPDSGADFEYRGLINEELGLPKEDLDEATKRALEFLRNGTIVNPMTG